jgi:hypothetical protein
MSTYESPRPPQMPLFYVQYVKIIIVNSSYGMDFQNVTNEVPNTLQICV